MKTLGLPICSSLAVIGIVYSVFIDPEQDLYTILTIGLDFGLFFGIIIFLAGRDSLFRTKMDRTLLMSLVVLFVVVNAGSLGVPELSGIPSGSLRIVRALVMSNGFAGFALGCLFAVVHTNRAPSSHDNSSQTE